MYNIVSFVFNQEIGTSMSNKQGTPLCMVITWIRAQLACVLLRSAVLCVRGSNTLHKRVPPQVNDADIVIALDAVD